MVAYGFVTNVTHGWRYVQGLGVLPSAIMIVFTAYVPESPKWLLRMNRVDEAKQTLRWLRPADHDTDAEVLELLAETKDDSVEEPTWAEVFACKKAMLIGCGLSFFQASTGINTVIFYSTTIFGFAGVNEKILATASVGLVNLLVTALATYLVDRMGRKVLILGGTYLMMLSLLLLSLVLLLGNASPEAQGGVAILAVLLFVTGFAIGLGAVMWVIMSEIMPTRLRAKAMSLFLCINWGLNLLIGLFTLTLINELGGVKASMDDDESSNHAKTGVAYFYFIFAAIAAASIFFMHIFVPETKGKSAAYFMEEAESTVSLLNPLVDSEFN